jgi:hypothetical protein
MAVDLSECEDKALHQKQIIDFQVSQIELLEETVKEQEDIIDLQSSEKDRLFEKWKTENELRHKAENNTGSMSWVAWGLAGGLALVSSTLLLVVLVD